MLTVPTSGPSTHTTDQVVHPTGEHTMGKQYGENEAHLTERGPRCVWPKIQINRIVQQRSDTQSGRRQRRRLPLAYISPSGLYMTQCTAMVTLYHPRSSPSSRPSTRTHGLPTGNVVGVGECEREWRWGWRIGAN